MTSTFQSLQRVRVSYCYRKCLHLDQVVTTPNINLTAMWNFIEFLSIVYNISASNRMTIAI